MGSKISLIAKLVMVLHCNYKKNWKDNSKRRKEKKTPNPKFQAADSEFCKILPFSSTKSHRREHESPVFPNFIPPTSKLRVAIASFPLQDGRP